MMTTEIKAAITLLESNGYRVSKRQAAKSFTSRLNALGKPYSENFDPNYKIKYKTPRVPYGPSTAADFNRARAVYKQCMRDKHGAMQTELLEKIYKRQCV